MSFAAAMIVALLVDALIGWPDALYRRIGHPVTWIGRLIGALDRGLNRGGARRLKGAFAVLIVLVAVAVPTLAVESLLPEGWVGTLLLGLLAWPLVAGRSLYQHVARVAAPLAAGDETGAREAVSMIVGRDPATLDQPAIARAALESLAENASDGVVAPVFWGTVAGLPGIAVYKAINTLDSMIGHRTPRHEAFGRVAARLDDVANLIPARLTGLMFVLVSRDRRRAFRAMMADARRHRSPNAGWPEAAMAGGLSVRMSGPRVYAGRATDDPWLNGDAPDPTAEDLNRGLALFLRAVVPLGALLAVAAAFGG
ncbi:cobalamin biosynthesis protein CobD [Alphaproteobacteria bacterium GH1-50]|uniref:Cobalamin biosynthesis protein CobD n=1 Tax=Kangsaoukella pontilimi TaxID=2691042 RepID=A0A7C9II17_9RHOB|nr:adenosylcobinamide-phosphate synthase CbiB [Kangsaoukella pontilimi]MXQ09047.1 cobalamin biosynthesis protein CobD [Kangsaoukella pontilimi]